MEKEKEKEKEKTKSPNSSASSSNRSDGVAAAAAAAAGIPALIILKSVPKSVDANAFATTFVQADAGSFKQVVQMLTGASETAAKHHHHSAPLQLPAKNGVSVAAKATGPKKPAFKLYERRGSLKSLKMISPMIPSFAGPNSSSLLGAAFSPRRQPETLSPSVLDLPSLTLSPVTPLIPDPFDRSPQPNPPPPAAISAEERAIADKGFYLHPSPRTTPRDAVPPTLLPLFPVTSPTAPSASAAAASSS